MYTKQFKMDSVVGAWGALIMGGVKVNKGLKGIKNSIALK